ncbi:hypothetical protein UlMin_019006 [Ulmus minor]
MEIRGKYQMMIILLLVILYYCIRLGEFCSTEIEGRCEADDEVHVGLIMEMGSMEAKIVESCISLAISDFYELYNHNSTRLVLHTREYSKGEALQVLSLALDLLNKTNVKAILFVGGQTRLMETNLLAELGNKSQVPVISLSDQPAGSSAPPYNKYPFFAQIRRNEIYQFKAIAAIVEVFKWKDIIVIHEDIDFGRDDMMTYMFDSLQEKNIFVTHRSAIANSNTDIEIVQELYRIMKFETTVYIVHFYSQNLLSKLLTNAKKLGMMEEGYAWFMSASSMNLLQYYYSHLDSSVIHSMQGVVGLKSHIPTSKALNNLTSRLRRKLYINNPDLDIIILELNAYEILAYDSTWALAEAIESTRVRLNLAEDLDSFNNSRSSKYGLVLLKKILGRNFMGLGGDFRFANGKLVENSNVFELVNVVGKGERRVGFWTYYTKKARSKVEFVDGSNRGIHLLSSADQLESKIIWPGGLGTRIPKSRRLMMTINGTSSKKLRIAVPWKIRQFKELVQVDYDAQLNATYVKGFCIDVFKAAIDLLPYRPEYEFIPFGWPRNATSYDDMIYQVYLQKYDVAVGDITIYSNRSLYVDFTLPFSDLGVAMLTKNENRNIWIFLKPFSSDLWMTSAAFFLLTGLVVWVIESPTNHEFQGSRSRQIGTIFWFSFSTLFFAHGEKPLNNLSKIVMIVWMFLVLILTSSYTATLTSMMTVEQIQLKAEGDYIGYHGGSYIRGVLSNLNVKGLKPLSSPEEFADALSKGSKHGGVSAIMDEIPYIKLFLARYPRHYSMIKSVSNSNGFGFAFGKGSPLVANMSRAIAKLRETGELAKLEKVWFHGKSSDLISQDTTNEDPTALNFETFGGLFLISGISSIIALFLFCIRKKWQAVKTFYKFGQFKVLSIIKCLSNKIHNGNQETSGSSQQN